MTKTSTILISTIALGLVAAGCAAKPSAGVDTPASARPSPAATANIVETAVDDGNFTTLVTALQTAGLDAALAGEGPFTVFAPSDQAFSKLPEGTVERLLEDPEQLKAILTYHVVEGKVMAADVMKIDQAIALSGGTIPIDTSAGVRVGAATVVKADIEASNGVIHVIDTVLIP